jgi:hypothetical protein
MMTEKCYDRKKRGEEPEGHTINSAQLDTITSRSLRSSSRLMSRIASICCRTAWSAPPKPHQSLMQDRAVEFFAAPLFGKNVPPT